MIVVSNDFKTAMKQPVKEIQAYLTADGIDIRDDSDLISFKVSCDGGMCKSAMRKLEAQYLGEHNLLGKWVSAGFGVKLASGAYEYLKYGSFLVSELTFTKDTGVTNIVAYDKMVNAMKAYTPLNVEYPIDLYTYTQKLCEACGLELGNSCFGGNLLNLSANRNTTINGVTFTVNGDGSITINGTATENADFFVLGKWNDDSNTVLSLGGTYKFTIVSSTESEIDGYLINGTDVINWVSGTNITSTFTNDGNLSAVMFRVKANTTVENVTIFPILEKSANANYVVDYVPYSPMNDWQITQELWANIDGITYRDIFVQIAQATASTCIVGNDDKIYFKPLTATGERLTYDNMFKLKLEPVYGEINSVVLSRSPVVGEDIYMRDEASIQTNGLTEFKIENNEIVDKSRETAITPIYDALHGVSYYPFETTTEGLGWYEIGDCFDIVNDAGDVFPTALFNFNITVDGSIKETLKTVAETKTQTQYQYATSIAKRVKNAEIIVNKQEGYIQSLISDMYDEDGVVNEKFTKIYQDIDGIINSVQNSGGNNLIKNSVMFASDSDGTPTGWDVSADGELKKYSDPDALASGGLSAHSFVLLGKTVSQTVPVKVSTEEEPTHYTFSTKIKKDVLGSCYIRMYNTQETYLIEVPEGTSVHYADYEIQGVSPKENYYIIEFYGTADSNATFTDNMLAVGEYKSQWTQANGEVMNTQVNINLNGVLVKSSVYAGDYTVMSPLEFAGYSDVSGTLTKVFSLNRDVTTVQKLESRDEVKMVPIKVVPITEGEIQGWAFVPST